MSKFGEWECWSAWESWNDEKFHLCWYVTEIGTQTYIAKTDSESDAKLIASAPEMYRILQSLVGVLSVHSYSQEEAVKIYQLLAYIDGTEADNEPA